MRFYCLDVYLSRSGEEEGRPPPHSCASKKASPPLLSVPDFFRLGTLFLFPPPPPWSVGSSFLMSPVKSMSGPPPSAFLSLPVSRSMPVMSLLSLFGGAAAVLSSPKSIRSPVAVGAAGLNLAMDAGLLDGVWGGMMLLPLTFWPGTIG